MSGGLVPWINFGAIGQKLGGNQAADIFPGWNASAGTTDSNVNKLNSYNAAGTQLANNAIKNYKDIQGYSTDVAGPPPASSGAYTSGGGGGSGYASSYDPNAEAAKLQIDQGIRQNQDALNRIDPQLATALNNINSQFNSEYNRLMGDKAMSDRNYDTSVTGQQQSYLDARQNNDNNSRNLLSGARRLLGAAGAGGGSADRFAAPNAAQLEGANQNAQVQQTNARNLAALATANEDNKRKFDSGFADLNNQKTISENGIRSQFEQQRADVLNSIAQLTGQKSILNGGNYQSALAAARPLTDRVTGILNNIDNLAANPGVVRANDITLARPDLANYTFDRGTAAANGTPLQDTSLLSPALTALLGYNQDQRQQQLV